MGSIQDPVASWIEYVSDLRLREQEIWDAFACDYDCKAEALSHVVALALMLSPQQAERAEGEEGLPAAELPAEQKARLDQAESLMRELGFLDHVGQRSLTESTLRFLGDGQMWFRWEDPHRRWICGLNWLPYSSCDSRRKEGFAAIQQAWRDRPEALSRQHYADFRQAADSGRLLFRLAISLSVEQVTAMLAQDALPVSALEPRQQALLEAALRLCWLGFPDDLTGSELRFELSGQFWLISRTDQGTSRSGRGWLPYSWGRA